MCLPVDGVAVKLGLDRKAYYRTYCTATEDRGQRQRAQTEPFLADFSQEVGLGFTAVFRSGTVPARPPKHFSSESLCAAWRMEAPCTDK